MEGATMALLDFHVVADIERNNAYVRFQYITNVIGTHHNVSLICVYGIFRFPTGNKPFLSLVSYACHEEAG